MHSELYRRIMNSKRYKQARNFYMSAHPLCELCLNDGIVKASQELHHKVEVDSARSDIEAWNLATSVSNFQALCRDCHHNLHKAMRSHSSAAHRQRQSENLSRWKERNGRSNPGA